MATYYLDPEGGNDSNNGTSFALRRKTIAGMTGLAAGDTVRIMASRDPVSLGNGTWTDNSATVTLASAATLEIEPCTAAWTASTNVTCTTSTTRRYGSTSSSFSIASGFTTGLAAFKAIGSTLNLSSYTAISFWLYVTSLGSFTPQGQIDIRLCSDTAGATPVDTLTIDLGLTTFPTSSIWIPVVIDKGSALGSAIQSVSVSFQSDPASTTFLINNLLACKGLSDSAHVSHACLIGKKTSGEPDWYPVQSINGTTLVLGSYGGTTATPARNYRGTTETVTTYAIQPVNPKMSSSQRTMPTNGSIGSPITWSAGWNRTDMSTQTTAAETWWTGLGAYAEGYVLSSRTWQKITGIALIHHSSVPITFSAASGDLEIACPEIVFSGGSFPIGSAGSPGGIRFDLGSSVYCDGYISSGSTPGFKGVALSIRRITGNTLSAAPLQLSPDRQPGRNNYVAQIGSIDNCGVGISGFNGNSFPLLVRGCTFKNNVTRDVTTSNGILLLDNCTFLSTTRQNSNTAALYSYAVMTNINGDRSKSALYGYNWDAVTQTAVRHAATGVAWQVTPGSTTDVTQYAPIIISLGLFALAANEAVSLKCWLRRTNTAVSVGIRVRGGSLAGIPNDVQVITAVAINTWSQETITFTPTAEGVVELEGFVYGGSGESGFFDDVTVV